MCQSKICTLPNELLSSIFHTCVLLDRNNPPFGKRPPLLFTVMCQRWRKLSLATPTLWSFLSLHERSTEPHIFFMRKALSVWEKYSGKSKLELRLDLIDGPRTNTFYAWVGLSPELDSFIERCERLEVQAELTSTERFWQQVETAKNLKELSLLGGQCSISREWLEYAIRSLSRLRSFICTQYGLLETHEVSNCLQF